MSFTKDELIYLAKVAEQAERFEDMFFFMKSLIFLQEEQDLPLEIFNLFSLACKICIYNRHLACKKLYILQDKPTLIASNPNSLSLIQGELRKKQSELSDFCDEILEILDKKLIPNAKSNENRVMYMKMKADKCKYFAEYLPEPRKSQLNDLANLTYKNSFDLACKELHTTNRIRLVLVLNYSVFCYEILLDTDFAIKLSRKAFDDATCALGQCEKDDEKDILLILQLIRDNMQLWQEEN